MASDDDGRPDRHADESDRFGDRRCPTCRTLMMPFGLKSEEIAYRCGTCGQIAI